MDGHEADRTRRRDGSDGGAEDGATGGTGGTGGVGPVEEVPGAPGSGLVPGRPEDVLAEAPDARDVSGELAAPPRRPLPWATLALAGCVVAAGAFAAGALVEKSHLHGSSGGTGTSAAGGGYRGGAGGYGYLGPGAGTAGTGGRFGGPGSGVTFGTVKSVDGSTIYVTDAQGKTVKVTTNSSTRVTESKEGSVGDIEPGQSVTVRGDAQSNGDIAATTVAQGSPGGFLGRGGQGGGQAGGQAGGAAGGTGGT